VPRDAQTRDWGIAAADDARGLMYYFGGGHSTYQVNDVAIYAVGANRWLQRQAIKRLGAASLLGWHQHGHRRWSSRRHQRNSYVVIDGRLWHTAFHSRRWDHEIASQQGRESHGFTIWIAAASGGKDQWLRSTSKKESPVLWARSSGRSLRKVLGSPGNSNRTTDVS